MVKPRKNTDDIYQLRGQALHAITINVVIGKLGIENVVGGLEWGKEYALNADDAEAVAICVGHIEELRAKLPKHHIVLTEHQLDLSTLGISGGIHGNRPDIAFVVPGYYIILFELKFGVRYVPPPRYNIQMRTYSWGLLNEFGGTVVVAIKLQPPLGGDRVREEHVFAEHELDMVAAEVINIVAATKIEGIKPVRGYWCEGCGAKDVCPCFREMVYQVPRHVHMRSYIESIEPAQRRVLYEDLLALQEWTNNAVAACQGFVLDSNGLILGFTKGNARGRRMWKEGVQKHIEEIAANFGHKPADLVETKFKSPAQVEKVLGKKRAVTEELEKHWEVHPGKELVVREKR